MQTRTAHNSSKAAFRLRVANTSRPKPVIKSVFCRQWCFLAHDGRKFCLSARKGKHYENTKTTWRSKPRVASSVPRQELGTRLCVKWVEDSPSVLSLGRLCDEWEVFLLLATRRKPPTQTKGKKTILCCTDNFVRGTRAADAEVEETMLNVAGTFL